MPSSRVLRGSRSRWRRAAGVSRLLSFRLRLELLYLPPLLLDFRLLRLQFLLGLRLLILVVLHRITHDEAGPRAELPADRRTRARSADGRTDDCAGASAHQRADTGAFFAR